MSVKEIYTTLYDFLVDWLTDAGLRAEYGDDLEVALEHNGFEHVDADDILACLPLVAEDLPPVYQQAIYEHLNAMSEVDSGGSFEVHQGGGETGAVQGGGGGYEGGGYDNGGPKGGGHEGGESPMDAVVRHIQHIQNITENNYSYIDDSGDVTTTVTTLGDVDFDQIVASGAGAVAADGDVEGVNTGVNYGIVAGGDVEDSEVTSVFGDGNVTGDFGDDATVVSGDDNVLAKDSNVVDGDFEGGFIGGDVDADHSALNFGDGDIGQDNSVDESVHIKDSYNTDNSKHANDSFNTDDSYNTDASTTIKDSFQDNDEYTDNSDNSTHTRIDVEVKDSFQDNDEYSFEEEKHSYTKTVTETDIDIDAEYTSDDDGIDNDGDIDAA